MDPEAQTNVDIAVVGVGNVGAALLFELAAASNVRRVSVIGRSEDRSYAAIRDVAGADPAGAAKMSVADCAALADAQIVILACGVRMRQDNTRQQNLDDNTAITRSVLGEVRFRRDAIVIAVASPVDTITREVQDLTGLPPAQVMGFGGDLDRNRLAYILHRRNCSASNAFIIGEHGERAIPVYEGEHEYDSVAAEVRQFVVQMAKAGPLRNQSAGVALGRLCQSIAANVGRVHTVCGMHPAYQVRLTWPFQIGRQGLLTPLDILPGHRAEKDLEALLHSRAGERP